MESEKRDFSNSIFITKIIISHFSKDLLMSSRVVTTMNLEYLKHNEKFISLEIQELEEEIILLMQNILTNKTILQHDKYDKQISIYKNGTSGTNGSNVANGHNVVKKTVSFSEEEDDIETDSIFSKFKKIHTTAITLDEVYNKLVELEQGMIARHAEIMACINIQKST